MSPAPPFTDKQGQHLAFIYAYSRIFRQPPAEADMQRHFQVSPPSVHQMVRSPIEQGVALIRRTPGVALRSELTARTSGFILEDLRCSPPLSLKPSKPLCTRPSGPGTNLGNRRYSRRQHWPRSIRRVILGRGVLLWLLGVPIPIIILIALLYH